MPRDPYLRVSVAMATHNGERFLAQQVRSILAQLDAEDELVIVDDASTDGTLAGIRSFADPRITLICLDKNVGVLAAFEHAIWHTSGEIVFLSDQDDVWEPAKVATTLKAFVENPEVRVISSDASLIDEDGSFLPGTYYSRRGRFCDGFLTNVFRSKYQGCTMAFRSSLKAEIFPFPRRFDVMHDIWIGSRNRLTGGKTLFLKECLVRYRRHASNVTGNVRLRRSRQLRIRVHLVLAAAMYHANVGWARVASSPNAASTERER